MREAGNPYTILLFYLVMAGLPVFFMHPALVLLSLVFSVIHYRMTLRESAFRFFFHVGLPVFLLVVLANVLFTHQGMTLIAYFPNGNPFTLESLLFGIAAGMMMVSVLFWMSAMSRQLTSEKWLYIFGGIFPKFGLLFSMILRFVPLYHKKYEEIHEVMTVNAPPSGTSLGTRLIRSGKELGMTFTWALEHGVVTADSMAGRGYGVAKRSHYRRFIITPTDVVCIACLLVFLLFGIAAVYKEWLYFEIYPSWYMEQNAITVVFFVCYGALAAGFCFISAGVQ